MTRSLGPVGRLACVGAVFCLCTGTALGETVLRIGLAEDPDVLDPTLARTYVGRIVFASLCDKLFDIDQHLNIVPQLALGADTSEDGRSVTIKLRRGVKFHDGEAMDGAAVKASLERHMQLAGSFRKPELAAVNTMEVLAPDTVRLGLKAPFSPLLAQLADRAGMIMSPKAIKEAGDKFGLKPVCAGPFRFVERVQQDRIVLERFAGYWDAGNVHIDRLVFRPIAEFDGAPRRLAVRQPRFDPTGACHRPQGNSRRSEAEGRGQYRARLPGHHPQPRQWRSRKKWAIRQGRARAPGAGGRHRPQGAFRRGV